LSAERLPPDVPPVEDQVGALKKEDEAQPLRPEGKRTLACGKDRHKKAQGLSKEVIEIVPGLLVQPDFGRLGHYYLAGATLDLHEDWAASRAGALDGTGPTHPLTLAVRAAIVVHDQPCP
jgi:hypothetical protein